MSTLWIWLKRVALLLVLAIGAGAAYGGYLSYAPADLGLEGKPTVAPAPGPEASQDGALTYRFLGNTNLLISDGETSLLTDGWFSRFSTRTLMLGRIAPDLDAIQAGLERAEIDRLAAVIPVHSHFDHAMDSPEVAKRTGALLVGSSSSANIARGWGLPEAFIRVARSGEPMRFGAFTVTLIDSKHFPFPSEFAREQAGLGQAIEQPLFTPAAPSDYKEGVSYSVLIEHPEATLLIQGSAGFVEGALDGLDVDLLFLGIGGLGSQTEAYRRAYWAEVADAVRPEVIVPIHFDSLTAPLADELTPPSRLWSEALGLMAEKSIRDFEALAAEAGAPVFFPELWVQVPVRAALDAASARPR
ncbi:MAG: MBL fold metallo-hydrolase [Pseudomonadota bacterium]